MSAVKVLVLGGGGREHALAWTLSQDSTVSEVISAPGNPGTAACGRNLPVDLSSAEAILALADREHVDLTVVGPEAPLERGVADLFRAAGRPIVGPSSRGAALECSKAHAKAFMARHKIPTARFAVCDDLASALSAVSGGEFGFPVVVKADGLAAGKGVTIANDRAEAEAAVRAAMVEKQFGSAGARLVIEECLSGPEVSAFYLCDGADAFPLGTAQDHKRILDDDKGPNTGGMGAFAPSPLATDVLMRQVADQIVEFNVRFGDPEAQVLLPSYHSGLANLLADYAARRHPAASYWMKAEEKVVGVVLASRGYPASSESGRTIEGLDRAAAIPGVLVFHAGTKLDDRGRVVTAGGRVLTVVGRGKTYEEAMATAYKGVAEIKFDGMQYRRDIGKKALQEIS
jgi:phosphoribosylamine--glycine ligase